MPNKDKDYRKSNRLIFERWERKDTGFKLFTNRAEIEQSKFLTTLIKKEFLTIELIA